MVRERYNCSSVQQVTYMYKVSSVRVSRMNESTILAKIEVAFGSPLLRKGVEYSSY